MKRERTFNRYRNEGGYVLWTLLLKLKVDVVVSTVPVEKVIAVAKKALYTGNVGDGKIFVYNVQNVVRVRTGEEGYDALTNET